MSEPKTIADFGGPYVDDGIQENPEAEMLAEQGNTLLETTAHMSRTSVKARVSFDTVGSGNPTVATASSHWGLGVAQHPTLVRTGPGLYTITYAATYDDANGVTETVGFDDARVTVRSSDATDDIYGRPVTVSGAAITIVVESPKGTAADVGDNSAAAFTVSVDALGG